MLVENERAAVARCCIEGWKGSRSQGRTCAAPAGGRDDIYAICVEALIVSANLVCSVSLAGKRAEKPVPL